MTLMGPLVVFAAIGFVLVLGAVAVMKANVAARTGRAHMEFATEKLNALQTHLIELAERVDGVLDEAKQTAKTGDDAVRDDLAKELDVVQQRLAAQTGTYEAKIAEVEESVQAGDGSLSAKIAAAEQRSTEQALDLARRADAMEQQVTSLSGKLDGLAEELSRTDKDLRALEVDAGGMREDLDAVDAYVRDTFQARLDAAMQAFDGTVTGVLGEMKDELLRGVNRIEEIEAVVAGRGAAHDRLLSEPADEEATPEPSPSDERGSPTDE